MALGPALVWCSTRHGGVSSGPFRSLNLGDRVGDDPVAVTENRRRLTAGLGLPVPPVWLRQVHGAGVVTITEAPPGRPPEVPPEADGSVTAAAGVPMAVLGADCAMVALACEGAAGVVHAGHAGLLAGVIEAAVTALRRIGSERFRAYLGPCIRPARYEFGAGRLAGLVDRLGASVAATTSGGRPALDLPAAVRVALERAGVDDLADAGVCTAGSHDHFSYRRDGTTGRQAMVVMLAEPARGVVPSGEREPRR